MRPSCANCKDGVPASAQACSPWGRVTTPLILGGEMKTFVFDLAVVLAFVLMASDKTYWSIALLAVAFVYWLFVCDGLAEYPDD